MTENGWGEMEFSMLPVTPVKQVDHFNLAYPIGMSFMVMNDDGDYNYGPVKTFSAAYVNVEGNAAVLIKEVEDENVVWPCLIADLLPIEPGQEGDDL